MDAQRQFDTHRPHLRAVAYRMLGSLAEADDAVQESWLRLQRTDTSDVQNLGGWLTTVVSRICLNMLRDRREEPTGVHIPEAIVSNVSGMDPEHEALLADSVGLALQVVLDTLTPAERLAFVLHDLFAVPFDEVADVIGRTPTATRQLASRARRRVQDGAPAPDPDVARQREVVDAFTSAARGGDFDALLALLDPNVVVRSAAGVVRGAHAVAGSAMAFSKLTQFTRPALVNGVAGAVAIVDGRPVSVAAFTVSHGKVLALDVITDPERLSRLDLTVLDD